MIGNLSADMILMPVPLQHAQKVADFVKRLDAGNATTDDEAVAVPDNGEWTQAMIRRLVSEIEYPAVIALLDQCASSAGEWIDKADVEVEGDISPYQLRNELGALSKRTRRMFGDTVWPMQYKRERGKYSYRLDPILGGWWAEARKERR